MSLTNHPNIIRELFLYFARFPNRDNVLKRFRKRESDPLFAAYYSSLCAEIEAWPDGEHSLCPAIDDLVFSSNSDENYLAKQIEDMDGKLFLHLDYGEINRAKENAQIQRKADTFALAISVGMQWKTDDLDAPEHAALADYTLNALRCVIAKMQADNATCSGSNIILQFPHTIVPYYARGLQNATGWTLAYNKWAIDLI